MNFSRHTVNVCKGGYKRSPCSDGVSLIRGQRMQAGCQPKNLNMAGAVVSGHEVLKRLFGRRCLGCWQEVLELYCQYA